MIKEELRKVIDLQEELGNPFVVMHKPRAKESIKMLDSDTAAFDIIENELVFDFWEIEGFTIALDKIKEVVTEVIDNITMVFIKLKYGKTIMLNFLR